MTKYDKAKTLVSYTKRYTLLLVLTWSIIVLSLIFWNGIQINGDARESAKIHTTVAINKDILYRNWAAMHGGVYAPITNKTPSNPYLSHMPERDITTPSGKNLTLINPAYMTRQVYELEKESSQVRSHLTSLKPTRLENAPDEWEKKALESFEQGVTEVSSIELIDGNEYFRLMRPFIVEEGCIKCHADKKYKIGDIRGGISVSMPMDSIRELTGTIRNRNKSIYFLFWLVGLGSILFGYLRMSKSESKRIHAEKELESAYLELEMKVQDRTAELEEKNEELMKVDKIKSDFLDTISHELRTPLTSIIGYSRLLLDGTQGEMSEAQANYIERIWSRGNHQLQLINDVLDFSKIGSGHMKFTKETIAIASILTDVAKDEMPLARQKGQEIVLEVPDGICDVHSDKMRFKQILSNIVNNAIKFTPDNGTIVIKADNADEMVKISIIDNGIGIKEEDIGKIFDDFIQVDQSNSRRHGGTGLGLAIVRDLVEHMGGQIYAESEYGKGSTFSILIPQDAPRKI